MAHEIGAINATRADISPGIAVKLNGVTSVTKLVTLPVIAPNLELDVTPALEEAVVDVVATTATRPGILPVNAPLEAPAVVVVAVAVVETATTATNRGI